MNLLIHFSDLFISGFLGYQIVSLTHLLILNLLMSSLHLIL